MEVSRLQDNRHMQVVRLSVLRNSRLHPPGNITGTHFCWRLSRPQGHSAVGKNTSMKNSNYNIGNRNRDLPACSTVPQPNAPSRARAARGGIVRSREDSICYRFIIIIIIIIITVMLFLLLLLLSLVTGLLSLVLLLDQR